MIILNPTIRKHVAQVLADTMASCYPENIKKRIINEMLWTATCDSEIGKKDGIKYAQAYWSEAAILKRISNLGDKKSRKDDGLIHEHLVPKNLIKKYIENQINLDENLIENILNNYNHSVVVTKLEDKKLNDLDLRDKLPRHKELTMQPNINKESILFSRYIIAKIPLFHVEFDKHTPQMKYKKLSFKNNEAHISRD